MFMLKWLVKWWITIFWSRRKKRLVKRIEIRIYIFWIHIVWLRRLLWLRCCMEKVKKSFVHFIVVVNSNTLLREFLHKNTFKILYTLNIIILTVCLVFTCLFVKFFKYKHLQCKYISVWVYVFNCVIPFCDGKVHFL